MVNGCYELVVVGVGGRCRKEVLFRRVLRVDEVHISASL